MKIVNITASFLSGDGIGNACRARARGLVNARHSVTVMTPCADPKPLEHPDFECILVPWTWLKPNPRLTADVMQRLQNAELILVDFGGYSPLHAWIRQTTCPLVVTYHGLTPGELIEDSVYTSTYLRSVGDLRQLPTPDLVVGDSTTILREYELLTGQTTSPRQVIQLFGHTRVATSPAVSNQSPTGTHAALGGQLSLLCVGRMYPNKNLELAIQVVRLLLDRGVDVRLRLIGGGGDTIAKRYVQRLKKLAEGLGDRVEFLGRVSADDLDHRYDECTAVLIPSLHEGFSLPAVEALMHGKPVFASRLGALPETLGHAAVLFDPFDAGALAKELAELARPGTELSSRLSLQAVVRAKELSEERFITAYQQVVAGLHIATLSAEEAVTIAREHQPTTEASAQMVLAKHAIVGRRLTGVLVASRTTENLGERYKLRAIVLHEGLVTLVAPPLSAKWLRVGEDWVIQFSVQLADAGDWTEMAIMLYHEDRQVTCSEVNPCWIRSETYGQACQVRAIPLSSLPLLARYTFASREIEGSRGFGWAYRLKSAIANPFLCLVHNLLIGPQTLLWDSLLQHLRLQEVRKADVAKRDGMSPDTAQPSDLPQDQLR